MHSKSIERYFFFGLLLATLIFTFLIFRPFWVVLVLGISFSIVLYPIYQGWKTIRFSNWLAALMTVLMFTIVLCGPLLIVGTMVFNQSQDLYREVVDGNSIEPFLESLDETVNRVLPEGIQINVKEKTREFVSFLSSHVANIFTSVISAFFSFLLMLLIIFYFLKDGERWRNAVVVLSPLSDIHDEKIIGRLAQSVNTVIKGSLLIALIQGILMGVGLWIFHVPNPALWGVVAAVASLLPTIGTALVSVPAIIFLYATGHIPASIGLLVWSVVAVGMIDNFLSPMVIGRSIKIPPLLILFAVLGGISFLGPVGLLIGPLCVSLLYTLVSIYRNEFSENSQKNITA
ncbi:MAG TPA: AI-2E family transporter [Candidatus Paceibacterota bacterium]